MMLRRLYRGATRPLAPLVFFYLRHRCKQGKEDALRLGERLGVTSEPRPKGPLLWVHAASVGEAISVLGLIERLFATRPGLTILLTTGTVASARLLCERLPRAARHQYVPVDLPGAVARFLDHWRPDLALWVESELWPNMVLSTAEREIPMVLLNGRLSERSYRQWQRCPGLIRPMLAAFELCFAQDEEQARRLARLGAKEIAESGDLKTSAPPLPVDPAALQRLQQAVAGRPAWVAASTHPGEEGIVASAHRLVAERHRNLLTIIVPRHPTRAEKIAATLRAQGMRVARRSLGEPITQETQIYLADTLGELGLFYRLVEIAFIGGSLFPKGGHNPFEAARLGCAVLHGPDMKNCAPMASALAAAGASQTVRDAEDLAGAVASLLEDEPMRGEHAAAAARAVATAEGVLDRVLARLSPWLDPLAPEDSRDEKPRDGGPPRSNPSPSLGSFYLRGDEERRPLRA